MIAAEVEISMFRQYPSSIEVVSQAPIEEWCLEFIGPKAEFRDQVSDEFPWTFTHGTRGLTVWHFAREESATMFRLRWGL